ncbi:hypothetical protein C7999DRAFT_16096 [Corynascus novoguineensis]|uniref:Uncharacterized protein n=1 Tax=Corynascus novoguineensis TaxID=1126955 RepID=A0AAN7HHI7_9PEZI|nr:hypothetical protein C7999DRAFT_16096 [Corynascus novoguineensis]
MAKLALSLAALVMSTATLVAAAPSAAQTSKTTFSFAEWVEDLIAHPDTALSADEAIAAAHAADVVGSAGGLRARAPSCDVSFPSANARDAAACVDDLAAKGRNGVQCVVETVSYFCQIGGAEIVGVSGGGRQSANCNDIARTAGLIFDSCWRADDTVKGSELCITNNRLMVHIAGR